MREVYLRELAATSSVQLQHSINQNLLSTNSLSFFFFFKNMIYGWILVAWYYISVWYVMLLCNKTVYLGILGLTAVLCVLCQVYSTSVFVAAKCAESYGSGIRDSCHLLLVCSVRIPWTWHRYFFSENCVRSLSFSLFLSLSLSLSLSFSISPSNPPPPPTSHPSSPSIHPSLCLCLSLSCTHTHTHTHTLTLSLSLSVRVCVCVHEFG